MTFVGDPDRLSDSQAREVLEGALGDARTGACEWTRPARAPSGISFPRTGAPWSSARVDGWEVHVRQTPESGLIDVFIRQRGGRRWYAASGLALGQSGSLPDVVVEFLAL